MLVCIEMFIAAMAHSWCFTYKAHRPEGHKDDEKGPVKTSAGAALREMARSEFSNSFDSIRTLIRFNSSRLWPAGATSATWAWGR